MPGERIELNFDQNFDQNKVVQKRNVRIKIKVSSSRNLHSGQALPSVGMRRHTLRRTYRIPRNYLFLFDGLPTPTEEADGNGYGVIAGWRGPSRPPLRANALSYEYLVPTTDCWLWTGVQLRLNLRADRQEPLPMFRCPGLPGFPFIAAFGPSLPTRLLTPSPRDRAPQF